MTVAKFAKEKRQPAKPGDMVMIHAAKESDPTCAVWMIVEVAHVDSLGFVATVRDLSGLEMCLNRLLFAADSHTYVAASETLREGWQADLVGRWSEDKADLAVAAREWRAETPANDAGPA